MFAGNDYSHTKEHNEISNLAKFEFNIIKGCRVIVIKMLRDSSDGKRSPVLGGLVFMFF
jgi:hypothetical protein